MTRNITALTFLQCLLARPGMYTPNGTLNEIVAFLAGYEQGARGQANEELRELADLVRWLHEVAGIEQSEASLVTELAPALARKYSEEAQFLPAARKFLEDRRSVRGRRGKP